ncbi:MAG: flagellar assembly protein FliW [Actinomycetota bacterium]|nr:flagellar assembly protein FliW [Actinomycetota bacterium]
MSTMVQHESTRFGLLEVDENAVLEFPAGLIGLPSTRWTLVTVDPDSVFLWLQSLEDPALALPVTNPWLFFPDFSVELPNSDVERVGTDDPSQVQVLVTVRASSEKSEMSANLRAPIVIYGGRGHQIISEDKDAPVRAPLFPQLAAEAA